MSSGDILAVPSPGSRALKNAKYENYCRLRASALPRTRAYREVGWRSKRDDVAYINACRLERRQEIQDRIAFLTRQEEDLVVAKRRRIEETLWSIHEADIGDYFEQCTKTEKTGEAVTSYEANRPKLLTDIPAELRQNIEKVNIDSRGRIVPQLYSSSPRARNCARCWTSVASMKGPIFKGFPMRI